MSNAKLILKYTEGFFYGMRGKTLLMLGKLIYFRANGIGEWRKISIIVKLET